MESSWYFEIYNNRILYFRVGNKILLFMVMETNGQFYIIRDKIEVNLNNVRPIKCKFVKNILERIMSDYLLRA